MTICLVGSEMCIRDSRDYYMILNVAVGGKYDDYWVDFDAFCNDEECSNKEDPDSHRFIIDWIEYERL